LWISRYLSAPGKGCGEAESRIEAVGAAIELICGLLGVGVVDVVFACLCMAGDGLGGEVGIVAGFVSLVEFCRGSNEGGGVFWRDGGRALTSCCGPEKAWPIVDWVREVVI